MLPELPVLGAGMNVEATVNILANMLLALPFLNQISLPSLPDT